MTKKELAKLAEAIRSIEVLDGCTPEEVEITTSAFKEVEVVLSDNPLVPQLVFEVMALIAKAHPKDVTMKISSVGAYATIIAQF